MRTVLSRSLFVLLVAAGCGGLDKAKVAGVDLGSTDLATSHDLSASSTDLAGRDLSAAKYDLARSLTVPLYDLAGGAPATFTADVLPIFQVESCLDCHMTTNWDPSETLDGAALVTYLTSTKSNECPSLPYITPGDPGNSFLYQKVTASGSCFVDDPMPDGTEGLAESEVTSIESWILDGAQAN